MYTQSSRDRATGVLEGEDPLKISPEKRRLTKVRRMERMSEKNFCTDNGRWGARMCLYKG